LERRIGILERREFPDDLDEAYFRIIEKNDQVNRESRTLKMTSGTRRVGSRRFFRMKKINRDRQSEKDKENQEKRERTHLALLNHIRWREFIP
jgi:hypothetical protein